MNRKQRRAMQKQAGEENLQKLADKMLQFDNLPDECLACLSPFDKKNKEMVTTWNVVIRDEDTVRLYCPTCWGIAVDVATQYKEQKNDK